jgi:uncharacterized membrane protein
LSQVRYAFQRRRGLSARTVQQEVAVALRMQQTRDGTWRFELLPNRSSSWTQTRRFLMVIALLDGLIALLFAWQGLWLVLPFSGLEVAALGAGLYCCSRATYRRELILVEGERVVVLRGGERVECRDELARAWTRLQWQSVCERGCSRLLLGSHGRFFEIGAFLVETERRQLAGDLGRLLGQPLGARAPEIALDAGLNREMGL